MSQSPAPTHAFIAMMAWMTSIIALATDVMLPVLPDIANDLNLTNHNDVHLVVTVLFIGFAVGQLFAGPLSDAFGRRPVILWGYAVFFVGCFLTTFAQNFEILLVGRVLQGLGMSGPRIIANAIVRDLYAGRVMARVMSLIMMVFILVPIIAPAVGQAVAYIGGWRATFATLLISGLTSCIWFGLAQHETLKPSDRTAFSITSLWRGLRYVFSNRPALGYILASGFVFGPFLGYLGTSQKLFQDVYQTGDLFALYFAIGAAAIGFASLVNVKFVEQFGMVWISRLALTTGVVTAAIFLGVTLLYSGTPPFWAFMLWLLVSFFVMGLNFGNLNALAMEPLGHIAGLGSAVLGALSTVMSLPVATLIGSSFAGTITPLVIGYLCAGLGGVAVFEWACRARV